MGNKSKMSSKAQGMKWAMRRDMVGARLPKSRRSWLGMQPAALFPHGSGRRFSAAQPRHVPASEINRHEQPWQKAARKQAKRAESHLGWNDRRLAREKRKAEAAQVSSIAERWS